MNLLQCLSLVLLELGAGTMLLTALLNSAQIRPSFFIFQSALGAFTVTLAAFLRGSNATQWIEAGLVAGFALAAGLSFRQELRRIGRGFLSISGAIATVLLMTSPIFPVGRSLGSYPLVFAAAGLFLLGATHTAMVLGHWYLLMRNLSFEYLVRFSWFATAAVVVRGAVMLAALAMFGNGDSINGRFLVDRALHANTLFLAARVTMGIVAPLGFTLMALRCAKLQGNQAATGLLYLSEAFVFFGELFAAFLML